ncbi:hypothetical protein Tco_1576605 [Tanacetum coccineum]
MGSITSLICVLTQEHLDAICAKCFGSGGSSILDCSSDATWHKEPSEMVLNAFIRTADPCKVRIVERARAENEGPVMTVAKHRTVTLLPTSVSRRPVSCRRACRGLSQMILFAEADVLGLSAQKKRVSTEARGGDHTDSVTGPSLRSVAVFFKVFLFIYSSHHSATNSCGPEGDSFVRSAIPMMTEATTMTTIATTVAIPTDVGKDKVVPHPSVFGVPDDGFGGIKCSLRWTVTKGFELNDGRSCANRFDHFTPLLSFKTIRGMEHEQLFAEFNVPPHDRELSDLEISSSSLRSQNQGLVSQSVPPILKDVIGRPLDHPLSAEALIEPPLKNVTPGPEGEEKIDASAGGDLAFSKLDDEARDAVL